MANVTVIGAQWGDEGKGKIVDWLASRADAVVRFQGGHNAGHTLVVGLQGRLAEAEQLVRQDLPPEQAANNIAWLKAATARTPTGEGRSWSAVTRGGGS